MCELFLAAVIVGAVETHPGNIRVEMYTPIEGQEPKIETVYMYKDTYLQCFGPDLNQ